MAKCALCGTKIKRGTILKNTWLHADGVGHGHRAELTRRRNYHVIQHGALAGLPIVPRLA